MLSNYYTLRHIALDLNDRLRGKHLVEIFSQERNQLIVGFEHQSESSFIVVSCEPSANYLYFRKSFSRAKKNSMDFFPSVIRSKIDSVQIHPRDRILVIDLDVPEKIVIQLFGSRANVVLVDSNESVIASFLNTDISKVSLSDLAANPIQPSIEEIQSLLSAHNGQPLSVAVKSCFPQLGAVLLNEILHRANMQSGHLIDTTRTDPMVQLAELVYEIMNRAMNDCAPRIYFDERQPVEFSCLDLSIYGRYRYEEFPTLHQAIATFIGLSRKDKRLNEKLSRLTQKLQTICAQINRTLSKIQEGEKLLERSTEYGKYADLLMANLHIFKRGTKFIEVPDLYSPTEAVIKIPLDPRLEPARNADRYYEKSRKLKRAAEESKERKQLLNKKLEISVTLLNSLKSINDLEDLEQLLQTHRGELKAVGITLDTKTNIQTGPEVPFRVFTVTGGFQVWAGKSSSNNDLLTMKYSKPNDLWFHARGSGGSHVILRAGTGNGEPSKKAIEEAASIAAYYSKMKNAKTVPVAMTLKKFVRKPKGSPVGTVVIEREKVLLVEPRLPFDNKKNSK